MRRDSGDLPHSLANVSAEFSFGHMLQFAKLAAAFLLDQGMY
jgi:hypothetical protein